jgi:hypothetical protein
MTKARGLFFDFTSAQQLKCAVLCEFGSFPIRAARRGN